MILNLSITPDAKGADQDVEQQTKSLVESPGQSAGIQFPDWEK
jgi:hypothetical protein